MKGARNSLLYDLIVLFTQQTLAGISSHSTTAEAEVCCSQRAHRSRLLQQKSLIYSTERSEIIRISPKFMLS